MLMVNSGIVLLGGDFPGVAGEDHVAQAGEAVGGFYLVYLLADSRLVAGALDISDDADGQGQCHAVHHGQLLVQEVGRGVSIMYQHIIHGVTVLTDGDSLEQEAITYEALVAVGAEDHLLAVYQVDGAVGTHGAVGDGVVDAVIEDYTVLQNFDH